MKYSKKELGFILYNNRSVKGVVNNFLSDNINFKKLIEIENKFEWVKSFFYEDKVVEIDPKLLNIEKDDEIILPEQLRELENLFKSNIGKYSESECEFLKNRKIPLEVCDKWGFLGLSNFKDKEQLRRIGATLHPVLDGFLQDGISEGGIVQPLYKDGKLVNCSIRRISDSGKLKYTLAVPDIPLWGIDDCFEEEVWICEGIFDMICLRELGIKAITPSSAIWSSIQLYQLIELKPKNIVIFCDNDEVGLKSGMVLNKFFNLMGVDSVNVKSKSAKDACEHFWEKELSFDQIEPVKITKDILVKNADQSFDFLKYLTDRKF